MSKVFNGLIAAILVSVGLLLVGGLVLDVVQGNYYANNSFFRYRIYALNRVPFWFVSVLLLVAINGLWLQNLSRLVGWSEFSPFRENGRVSWDVPVQWGILYGKNLVLVCGILLGFLVIQGMRI